MIFISNFFSLINYFIHTILHTVLVYYHCPANMRVLSDIIHNVSYSIFQFVLMPKKTHNRARSE